MKTVKKNRKSKIEYLENFMVLDTETSNNYYTLPLIVKNKKQVVDTTNLMCWINSIQILDENDNYIQFRKPSELITFLRLKVNEYCLNENKRIVIYIHNLAYDMSYLEQPLFNEFNITNCLATDKHKYISLNFDNGIEFRCSYRLSGKSLDKWSKDLNTEHRKKVGVYDYDKIIYQDSVINANEYEYDKEDVYTLKECLLKQFEKWGDNVATTPVTSTGYIRRIARKKALADRNYKKNFAKIYGLNEESYRVLNSSKSGGYTYTSLEYRNHHFKNTLIGHGDFQSHYPSQQRCYEYPIGKFTKFSNETTLKEYKKQCEKYVVYIKVLLKDLKLKKEVTFPFLQSDKLHLAFEKTENFSFKSNNGRVVESNGSCAIYLSDKMFDIIRSQYTFKYSILEIWRSKKGILPEWFTNVVNEQFKNKSDFKFIHKLNEKKYGEHSIETIESAFDLLLSKQLLNGIFGMSYENPIKTEFYFNEKINEWDLKEFKSIEEQLEKFNNSYNSFMPFQWGCYTTELAKYELFEYINAIGYHNCIYCDTDSIFYLKNEKTEKAIEELNVIKHKNAINVGAYIVTEKNEKVFYDIFDKENDIKEFKALHSKCYAYKCVNDDEITCTIAGVTADNKKIGSDRITREKELGTIENLESGFTFTECGGTLGIYCKKTYGKYLIDGHEVECGNGIVIAKTTKTLSDSELKTMY